VPIGGCRNELEWDIGARDGPHFLMVAKETMQKVRQEFSKIVEERKKTKARRNVGEN